MANKSGRRRSRSRKSSSSRQWRRMDLHLHTPGSNDYQEPTISYLDILRQAEIRGLDIIAFTDHNTVAGYGAMRKEIEKLLWLEELGRQEPEEKRRLEEYRRLLNKILILPGFEFTATFGFHILGIFPQDSTSSFLEHLLLKMNVPPEALQTGSSNVGATTDVLSAYRIIDEAGGIVIGAHANSGNGVAMRGLDFGGQTRIAYTQDPHLHVLEVTDLEKRGRYTTRRFFDGSKPEYPRPMRCIQGSDAHRLVRDPAQQKVLGIGGRITEVLLDNVSFSALSKVLKGTDFSLTRPYRGPANPVDFVQLAREEGESIVQAFHTSMAQRGGNMNRILSDIGAMANTNGGAIYVGASADPKENPIGVREAPKATERLMTAVANRFSPEPIVHVDLLPSQGKQILRITVEPGQDTPYAIDDNKFYVRDEADTSLAVRDEIVRLALKTPKPEMTATAATTVPHHPPPPPVTHAPPPKSTSGKIEPPRTGVEVVNSEKRQGTFYHTVRDMRNGNLIKNVTRKSARKLWHYAISQVEAGQHRPDNIKWQGHAAVLRARKKDDNTWYDLGLKQNGQVHIYYGVTDSGLNDKWLELIEKTGK